MTSAVVLFFAFFFFFKRKAFYQFSPFNANFGHRRLLFFFFFFFFVRPKCFSAIWQGRHGTFILAGCHVRASAGDLAVHSAFIPRVCLCVYLSVRYQTPFSSRHESGPSLFLSTGKHPVGGQLPRVFFLCSAWAEQRPSKPTTPQKNFRFFNFLSPVFGEHPPKHAVD